MNILSSNIGKLKTHNESKLLRYTALQLFQVVADVDLYHEFVPWCKQSKVTKRMGTEMEADLAVGFGMFLEKYKSKVTLNSPTSVKATSLQSNLLQTLNTEWKFTPAADPNCCWITFRIQFSFKSALYNQISDLFFQDVVQNMVNAFELRCQKKYSSNVTKLK